MENEEFLTRKALQVIRIARKEALKGDRLMTNYHLGRLDSFLYMLGYPQELNQRFQDILTLLTKNEKI